jgi:two-component system response regulator PilR (NtrC family)
MLARILGRSRSPVVIQGELGVGKSRFARWVHELSEGASRTYRRVPCQVEGIDLTSILNDVAGGGTVVFEHVDEAPRGLQKGMTRLLAGKLCEAGRVRVLATSRRDLAVEVLEGRVSPDLYFRLRVQCVEIPPLRERKEDIAVLARSILEELARSRGGPVPELTGDALEAAELYTWPGNVRQLRSELQRCAAIVHHAIGKRLLTEGLDGRLPVRTIHAPLTGRSLGERVAAAER